MPCPHPLPLSGLLGLFVEALLQLCLKYTSTLSKCQALFLIFFRLS
nr:MAG TPA: hypothetical protein [Caudoviricetes sp.]